MKEGLGDDREDGWLLLGGPEEPDELSSTSGTSPITGGTLSVHNAFYAATARTGGSSGGGSSGGGGGPVQRRMQR